MNFAICPISVVPIKASSVNRSEMISQLLFGEMVEVIMKKGKQWTKIRCLQDNVIGWVNTNQLAPITPSEKELFEEFYAFSLELIHPVMEAEASRPLCIGARLPNFDGMRLLLGEKNFTFSGQAIFPNDLKPSSDLVLKFAKKYLYSPFISGGRSPLGIDSSALIQLVYSFVGIALPRYAADQVNQGLTVDFVQQAQAGDIAFFENKAGNITHTGILLPERLILHSYGHVRIDKIDHYGIFNTDTQKYSHRLRIVRRVLDKENIAPIKNIEQNAISENQIGLF